jgi:hypothetical protein
VALPFDVLPPVRLLCPELIVCPASHAQVLGLVRAARATWVRVIELEKRASAAPTTTRRNVRAAQAVAFEHVAARGVRDAA